MKTLNFSNIPDWDIVQPYYIGGLLSLLSRTFYYSSVQKTSKVTNSKTDYREDITGKVCVGPWCLGTSKVSGTLRKPIETNLGGTVLVHVEHLIVRLDQPSLQTTVLTPLIWWFRSVSRPCMGMDEQVD